MENKSFVMIIGILSGLLFGIATPFSKILLYDVNQFQLAGLLYLGSGLFTIPLLIKNYSKNSYKRENKHKVSLNNLNVHHIVNHNNINILCILIFGGILGPLFLMLGLFAGSATSTSIWLNMELVITAILGFLIFNDNLDRYTNLGLIFTFISGLIISYDGGTANIVSVICIIIACFCWGIDNQLTSIVDNYSIEFITFLKGIVGGGINLTIGLIIANSLIAIDLVIYGLLLGIVSYGVSILLFVRSAQNLGATRSQILFSTAPFWGILFSIAILHEPFSIKTLFAMAFLVAGLIAINILVHEHDHKHEEIEHIHSHSHDDDHHEHKHESDNELKDKNHIHHHTHNPITHRHRHFPDLHHRHKHDN
ncbi:DMT family transporter [Methanobrevibacter filiformis]|uniref:EamA-like transporter family protein n=1 Tax=Methanobrevibacter filiformis TaxID=55758 RepID=A0A166DM43_9EURY|nr:DMT family transporter [Methanobrevibacter filiformis]KZX15744.1 EamA-like transporter family protein [Methanobrevibacter filiformis]